MSPESRHSREPEGSSEPERSPWGLASVALVTGLLQIIASIVLGLAPLKSFEAAAGEKVQVYLVVAALVGAGGLAIWLVRERVAVASAVAIAWPVTMWVGLRRHATIMGLAYHGEFVLHHFTALLCLIVALSVPIGWATDRRLGKLRVVPALLAVPGALMLAASHLGQVPLGPPSLTSPTLATAGAALLFAAWPVSGVLLWPQLGPRQRRPIVFVLLIPLLVRVGLVGVEGLSGALVPEQHIVWVGAAIVTTAIATLVLLRPRLELWVMGVVGVICLLGCLFAYWRYMHFFGNFEDGLGGLLQSLFGFIVPYPSYVRDILSAALMMGLFFTFVTVYAALVSAEDRVRGIALGLMVIAGLGFSSPHLVLMFGTGALLIIESMLPGAPHRALTQPPNALYFGYVPDDDGPTRGDFASVREIVEALAERLGLDPPTAVETGPGLGMITLRGDIDGPVLDLRARVEPSATRIEIGVGLRGRGDPVFELVPDPGKRGKRPAHLLARSHRVHGQLRALEVFGDAPLDTLTCFPTAYLRAWDGGVDVDLGRELVGLRVDHLEALVRSLARALDPSSSPAPPTPEPPAPAPPDPS